MASLRVSIIACFSLLSILLQKSSCSFKIRLLILSKTCFITGGPSSGGGYFVQFSRMMLSTTTLAETHLMWARSLPVWRSIFGCLSPMVKLEADLFGVDRGEDGLALGGLWGVVVTGGGLFPWTGDEGLEVVRRGECIWSESERNS